MWLNSRNVQDVFYIRSLLDDSPTTPHGLAKSGAIFKIGNFDPKMALLCGYDVDFIAIGAVRGYFISFNDSWDLKVLYDEKYEIYYSPPYDSFMTQK